ncbi:MAG TPA: ester cyclase [Anaerolineales bacterium]|nr:ester cyclase [Anaerolineales bacterium]
MSEQYKTAARNFIEKGLNQKDLSALEAYFGPDLIDHALPPGLPAGREGRKLFASALLAAFPDLQVDVEDLIVEGDRLVARYSVRGTHQGDLMGIPPTGKEVFVSGIAIDRFKNGQSVEHWEIIDQLGLMQ